MLKFLFLGHHLHSLGDDGYDVVLVFDNDVEGVGGLAQLLLVVRVFKHRLPFAEDVERAHEQREERDCKERFFAIGGGMWWGMVWFFGDILPGEGK